MLTSDRRTMTQVSPQIPPAQAALEPARPSRRWRRGVRAALFVVLAASALLAAAFAFLAAIEDPGNVTQDLPIPAWLEQLSRRDGVAYPAHATLGAALNAVGGPPEAAANQWLKAAAHARTEQQAERAVDGLVTAWRRNANPDELEQSLCAVVRHNQDPRQASVVMVAGLHCSVAQFVRVHVPQDVPIQYDSRPPIGGPHYETPYPKYGIFRTPILPGYWVHNLEHGAVVLLYNCPDACPGDLAELDRLYARLPPGRNSPSGAARLLGLPYADMDHRFAVVAWGRALELDALDLDQIAAFYTRYVDRAPECRRLICPS
jgi:hypothetical protein